MKESGESKTRFEGQLFRSGMEARWALFYRWMDLGWTHKPNPVDFESESFEPDFFLRQGFWTMVKGTFPTEEERKCFSNHSGRSYHPSVDW
jgi:hypothetical protein